MEREAQDALDELRNLRTFRAQTIKERELELANKGNRYSQLAFHTFSSHLP